MGATQLQERYEQLKAWTGSPQQRGRDLEELLADLIRAEGLPVRANIVTPYMQVDLSFVDRGWPYIVEAKWHQRPILALPLQAFRVRVTSAGFGTRGLFISMSGYSRGVMADARALATDGVLLWTQEHLDALLDGRVSFATLLRLSVLEAVWYRNPLSRPEQLLLTYPPAPPAPPAAAPPIAYVGGFGPLRWDQRVTELVRDFVGREWLLTKVDGWLDGDDARPLVIVGEPGIGKSAFVAHVTRVRAARVGAVYFCDARERRTLDPQRFVASVVTQLCASLPQYKSLVACRDPATPRDSAGDAFKELIADPAWELCGDERAPILLLVDSLDDASGAKRDTITDLLVQWAPKLPPWLRLLATTRPVPRVMEQLRAFATLRLGRDEPENREDVRRFVAGALAGLPAKAPSPMAVDAVDQASAGSFLLATILLDGLRAGRLSVAELPRVPPELGSYYHRSLSAHLGNVDDFRAKYYPILSALSAAQDALPLHVVAGVVRGTPQKARALLRDLGPFVRERNGAFELFHPSFGDWLRTRQEAGDYWCNAAEGHRTLADILWEKRQGGDLGTYGLRHIVTHLLAADRRPRAEELLIDPGFIRRRSGNLNPHGLVADISALARAGGRTDRVWRAVTTVLGKGTKEGFWTRFRSAANEYFGRYPEWPPALRDCLERSQQYRTMLFLCETLAMERDLKTAEMVARRMCEANRGRHDRRYGESCVRLSTVLEQDHRAREALSVLEEALSVNRPAGVYREVYGWLRYHQGILLMRLGHADEARAVLEETRDTATKRGIPSSAAHQLGVLALWLGDLDGAERSFRDNLRSRSCEPYNFRLAYEHRRLGQVAARRGDFDQARLRFGDSLRISRHCANWRYVEQSERDLVSFVQIPQRLLHEPLDLVNLPSLRREFGADMDQLAAAFQVLADRDSEYLRVVNADSGAVSDVVARFDVAHRKGLWHRTVLVLVADSEGRIALQRRRETESRGRWDVTVSGHEGVGETDRFAAVRETWEEIGLEIGVQRLERIGRPYEFRKVGTPNRAVDGHSGPYSYSYRTGKRNCERTSVFLLRVSRAERDALPAKWLALDEVARLAARQPDRAASGLKQLLHPAVLVAIRRCLARGPRRALAAPALVGLQ